MGIFSREDKNGVSEKKNFSLTLEYLSLSSKRLAYRHLQPGSGYSAMASSPTQVVQPQTSHRTTIQPRTTLPPAPAVEHS